MLSKCSNASCCVPFRHLKGGRLFLLERDRADGPCKSERIEYFWLCHDCSSTMTLRFGRGTTITTVLLPKPLCSIPKGVSLSFGERKEGLFLHSIASSTRLFSERREASIRADRAVAKQNGTAGWTRYDSGLQSL